MATFLNRFFSRQSEQLSLKDFPEHSSSSPLSVHAMTVAYQQKPVLWDVDYDAPANTLVAVVGPNGAGKTTFIKAVLDLIPRASGSIEFWGESYSASRSRIGYVPQRESVDWDFPISALEVVLMGRYGMIGWCKPPSKAHRAAALHSLELVGLADYADRQINQLSGGQQQRVFLARALTQEADLYFMDEPFAGVDAATEKAIVEILQRLKTQSKTVIAVHHDLTTVPEYFDNVLMINMGVIAHGAVKDVFTQENLKRTYGGRLTLLADVSEAISRASQGQPRV